MNKNNIRTSKLIFMKGETTEEKFEKRVIDYRDSYII